MLTYKSLEDLGNGSKIPSGNVAHHEPVVGRIDLIEVDRASVSQGSVHVLSKVPDAAYQVHRNRLVNQDLN